MKWEMVRLGDIGTYRKGPFGSALLKSMFVPKNKEAIKVYEQKNAINKNAEIGDYYISKEYFKSKMKGFEVFPGDIIVSCAGTIGETFVMPENIEQGIINQALMRIQIKPEVNKKYFLFYFDYILKQQSQNNSLGSAIKNIPPFEIFKNFVIPLPPLDGQKLIVEYIETKLNAVEKIKNVVNEQINYYNILKEKLYERIFNKFNSDIKTIEDICNDISDGTHFTPTYITNGIPFLSVKDLTKGYISFDDCRYVSIEEHKKLIKRCNPQFGDVLYTKVGTTGIAKAVDVKNDFSIFVSVALLKLKENISPIFIEKVLNLPFCKKQAEKLTQGATNKNLVIKDLKTIKLFCPDYTEQLKILDRIERIDKQLIKIYQALSNQSSYINALSSSILRKAFQKGLIIVFGGG